MPYVKGITVRACGIAAMLTIATAACSATSDNTSSIEIGANVGAPAPEVASLVTNGDGIAEPNRTPTSPGTAQWAGTYTYAFNGGANAAGTETVVTYTLNLSAASCKLTAEGYQTDETVLCSTKPIADGIDVAFKSYADGGLTDKYGNAVYSVGDPLFSLQRKDGRILTHWKGYPLPDDKPHPIGVYFHN
ncbi:DUF5991 domain-containing protein [Sphingomonas faeni]|uniref:DUF5991 domain-containing protein n=1 Tax=Sphingomonas faeni TaxID=185950 RepID=UPI003344BBC5